MRINVGILLMTAGAILAFAVHHGSGPVNLTVVGVVIMLGAAAGLWLSYRVLRQQERDDITLIKPGIEEQYDTAPHEYAIQEQIDVTPVAYQDGHSPTQN
ncbi:hypothetical protein F1D05_35475 [Kribbella qitaiheensis]|uniref:Uncharacterized protein n=1 Tax=Kribbella qitaiheensis TaxID=1544730 RepID=A0A7G6X7M4_9ACTN|nr:hypothetical protein [Kribbella qitaiheensis]QNE22239.1 hypothetical protein F1D05_35475 [Kribbella qitaiheensis]